MNQVTSQLSIKRIIGLAATVLLLVAFVGQGRAHGLVPVTDPTPKASCSILKMPPTVKYGKSYVPLIRFNNDGQVPVTPTASAYLDIGGVRTNYNFNVGTITRAHHKSINLPAYVGQYASPTNKIATIVVTGSDPSLSCTFQFNLPPNPNKVVVVNGFVNPNNEQRAMRASTTMPNTGIGRFQRQPFNFYAYSRGGTDRIAVQELYRADQGFMYTTDIRGVMKPAQSAGWTYNGIVFFAHNTPSPDRVPIYEFVQYTDDGSGNLVSSRRVFTENAGIYDQYLPHGKVDGGWVLNTLFYVPKTYN